ncbi:hypothetical protein [Micropruina sp.]|uniref:hypothetical protein n=1 Tax=Micropruina sp. TaxID=2737536 RepID=UPI0039E52F51
MTSTPGGDTELLLAERTRLLHIGPFKTGTTSLQTVARVMRPELLRHGVRYPGATFNQRVAVSAFQRRGLGWNGDGSVGPPPSYRHWWLLKREIEADHERRILLGHEYVSTADDATIARWVDELGPRLHVVITLRAFGRMLPSLWQERLKRNARRESFERWLKGVLKPEHAGYDRRQLSFDHAGLIRRWAAAAGPDRVTVIALDPNDHSFLFHRFEDLLGLPRDLLAAAPGTDDVTNRGLTVPEAELFRQLNRRTTELGLEWANHEWLNYYGALSRVVGYRRPGPDEPRLRLPRWALKPALQHECGVVDAIGATGVRLVGSADHLVSADRTPKQDYVHHAKVDAIPIDLAVEALIGVLAAATGRDAAFDRTAPAVVRKARTEMASNTAPSVGATARRVRDEVAKRLPGNPVTR